MEYCRGIQHNVLCFQLYPNEKYFRRSINKSCCEKNVYIVGLPAVHWHCIAAVVGSVWQDPPFSHWQETSGSTSFWLKAEMTNTVWLIWSKKSCLNSRPVECDPNLKTETVALCQKLLTFICSIYYLLIMSRVHKHTEHCACRIPFRAIDYFCTVAKAGYTYNNRTTQCD